MKIVVEVEPYFAAGNFHSGILSWTDTGKPMTPISAKFHFVDLPGAGRCLVVFGQEAVRYCEKAVQENHDQALSAGMRTEAT